MKKLFLLIAVLFVAASCSNNDDSIINPKGNENEQSAAEEIARYDIPLSAQSVKVNVQNQQFSFNFLRAYNEVAQDEENYCISPLSASLCLGMVLNGANGNTYTEIQKALGYDGFTKDEINEYAKILQSELPKLDNYATFTNANSIWIKNDFKILSSFVETNSNYYSAEVQTGPFNGETLAKINSWCSEKINSLIPSILDNIDKDALAYLINAIYFKGPWKIVFNEKDTKSLPFYKADGTEEKVATMYLAERIRSYSNDEITMVELPYGNEAFSMIVFMPTDAKKMSIDKLIANLDATTWNSWLGKLTYNETNLSLPSYKLTGKKNLVEIFKQLGIKDAFDAKKADFTNMSSDSLYFSLLLQKTYMDVNEKGTEAAAVTLSTMSTSEGPSGETPRIISFNHPFGFILREQSTGAILFAGKCGNPEK